MQSLFYYFYYFGIILRNRLQKRQTESPEPKLRAVALFREYADR